MIDFEFVSPTKIYFGKDKENLLGQILLERNIKSVLFVYGSGSIKKIGLYDKVVSQLSNNNIKYVELSGVRPNPDVSLVRLGVKLVKENSCDLILAVGGGSVIDTAKAISVSTYYDKDPYDFNLYVATPTKALPIGVILTLAASGSELSSSCVISNDETKSKNGFNSDLVRPIFAILNPELTFSVNKFQTGCGVVDIISHSLERYFSPSYGFEFSDNLALTVIKDTIICGEKCINDPNNYDARALMMLNGSYSHNGLTSLGKKYVMTIHALEHALSAYKNDIAHGAGLSVLIPAWMSYVYKYDIDKFDKFTKEVFNQFYVNKDESAKIGIQSLKSFFQKIAMPVTLKELGIKENDIPLIADKLTKNGTRMIGTSSIKPLTKEDIINIFMSVL